MAGYVVHYNGHRPHRSLGQAPPLGTVVARAPADVVRVARRDRLGGLIHEYAHVAYVEGFSAPTRSRRGGRRPAAAGLGILMATNGIRVAAQHGGTKRSLPEAFERLGLRFTPNWLDIWGGVQTKVIEALGVLRAIVDAKRAQGQRS